MRTIFKFFCFDNNKHTKTYMVSGSVAQNKYKQLKNRHEKVAIRGAVR